MSTRPSSTSGTTGLECGRWRLLIETTSKMPKVTFCSTSSISDALDIEGIVCEIGSGILTSSTPGNRLQTSCEGTQEKVQWKTSFLYTKPPLGILNEISPKFFPENPRELLCETSPAVFCLISPFPCPWDSSMKSVQSPFPEDHWELLQEVISRRKTVVLAPRLLRSPDILQC